MRQSHDTLLRALLGRRFVADVDMVTRLEAAGFPVAGHELVGMALRTRSQAPVGELMPRLVDAVTAAGVHVMAGTSSSNPDIIHFALSFRRNQAIEEPALKALAEAGGEGVKIIAVGSWASGIPALLASIEEAIDLAQRTPDPRGRGYTIQRIQDRPLLKLVTALAGDPRLQHHTELTLQPLIEYDMARDGDLLAVLTSYLAYPGNRTRAAAASHLSRSVFYQRIALISELLGVDLNDGEVFSALHTAVLARSRQ